MNRTRVILAALALAAVGLVAATAAGALGGAARSAAGPGPARAQTGTAVVRRESLTAQSQVTGTLGDAGSYSVVDQAAGTITALPAAGQVVRPGQVLYRVSGRPVELLRGNVPAYRDLSEGLAGPDVAELNADLVQLGAATAAELGTDPEIFSFGTALGVEKEQARLGDPVTGILALGQAVFEPTAIQVTGAGEGVVLGGPAQPGAPVLTASSTIPVITMNLDAGQRGELRDGEAVSITLPSGKVTPGTVSQVATVATGAASGSPGSSEGSGSSSVPTVAVQVTPSELAALGGLTAASVQVTITSGQVAGALVVPVVALLARAGGGYAVEEVTGGRHHLVAVTPGLFDDAAGLVQVAGPGLAAGQRVVVPAV